MAETISWAEALNAIDCVALDATAIDSTLGTLLKYQDDIARIQGSEAARLLAEIKADARTDNGQSALSGYRFSERACLTLKQPRMTAAT